MKKLLLLLIASPFAAFCQFSLTPTGLATQDESKYITYELEGLSKEFLYSSVKEFVIKSYKNPDLVLNEIENQSITIKGVQPRVVGVRYIKSKLDRKINGRDYALLYSIDYSITIHFKDDKLRFDIPDFTCFRNMDKGSKADLFLSSKKLGFMSNDDRIYDEDGNILEEGAKGHIESFFNDFTKLTIAYIKNRKSESDW